MYYDYIRCQLTLEENEWKAHENFLYYLSNFPVNLKLYVKNVKN